jgi:hypothetical protein
MRALLGSGLLLLVAAPAAAQAPDSLVKCAGIARDAERLACYDAAVAGLSAEARRVSEARAAESSRIAAEEAAAAAAAAARKQEAERQARREAFGGEVIGKGRVDPEEVVEVETTLSELLTNASGLGVFILGNGQMWRQTDTAPLPRLKAGDAVKLKRASLGGYQLVQLRTGRWVTVRRIK